MRNAISPALMLAMVANLVPPAWAAQDIAAKIAAMPAGAVIEVHLTNKQEVRGTRGAVSDSGFTLVDSAAGERRIAFSDLQSVKLVGKSHLKRNILIGTGIGVAALGITIGIMLRCGPFGCNGKIL